MSTGHTPGPELPEPSFTLRWHSVRAAYTVSEPNIGDTRCYTADQLRAYGQQCALAALSQGWVMMPKEPTEAMQLAGARSIIDGQKNRPGTSWADEAANAYRAMLAAAPKAADGSGDAA